MITPKEISKIQEKIRAGMSLRDACETERIRTAYRRWAKSQDKKIPKPQPATQEPPQKEESHNLPHMTIKERCDVIQEKLLISLEIAIDRGEAWAHKEAVNVLSRLLPEWKEKSAKKQVPLEAYQKMLEKALSKDE